MKLDYRAMLWFIVACGLGVSVHAQTANAQAMRSNARLSEAETIAAVQAMAARGVASDHFSGAVLIAHNGKPVFVKAYGYADRDGHIRNTIDTKFRFGSMGKMFTGVAILQLVQAGKVGLDAPLGKYLVHYPNPQVKQVTVRQLLTHTGGTGDIFGPEYLKHRLELKTLGDYVKLLGGRGLRFQPGSRWEYSNYGFVLLGRIVEVVSGESYYAYVRKHIFEPAGMTRTGNLPENQHPSDLSVPYTRFEFDEAREPPETWWRPFHPATDTLPYRGTSAGGGYSTVEDFLRFANALTAHKLLNEHYTELLVTGTLPTPSGFRQALGFGDLRTMDGVRFFGHAGGAPGMNGELDVFPASRYTVVVLANMDPPSAQVLAKFIMDRLPLSR